jgi:hypothetical protein
MTVLQPSTTTIQAEDNFRLVYNGTYTKTILVDDPSVGGGKRIDIEEIKGPLPRGKFLWDGTDYLGGLEEGQAKLVPFDLVRVFFGDPRSVPNARGRTESSKGVVGDIPPREHEIRRLATLYGLYEANAPMLPLAVPDVTIMTADDIEVICPATDPEGEHIYGYAADTAEVHDVATQLANMRQQIALLEAAQKAEEKKGAKNDGADVAHDGPPVKR